LKVGLHIGKFDWAGSPRNIGKKLTEIAQKADEVGFESIWVMDHVFQLGTQFGTIHGPETAVMLEGNSVIAYLAALTKKIKLGVQVTCNFFRNPALLIKILTTIDVLSEGRSYLGIGAGWFEREARGYGYKFPSLKERFERLEETLQIAKHMWSGNTNVFEGKFLTLTEPINVPHPLSKPHPPILIGGAGEKRTLRLVAKYGDACNIVLGTTLQEAGVLARENITWDHQVERLMHKYNVLKQHCDDIGRSYEEIEKTATTYIKLAPDAMNSSEIIQICKKLADVGCQHLIFNMPNVDDITPLEIMGREVIKEVKGF
jgi:F420-dependent oxidoreductase-like protein